MSRNKCQRNFKNFVRGSEIVSEEKESGDTRMGSQSIHNSRVSRETSGRTIRTPLPVRGLKVWNYLS